MQAGRAGLERLRRIGHHRQILVPDLDQRGGRGGLLRCLGDHRGHPVADEAHNLIAEHRLVRDHQAVAVVGHVTGGENGMHARLGQGAGRIHGEESRVRPPGEDQLHVQHAGQRQIPGVSRAAGDLGLCVAAHHGLSDSDHQWASPVNGLPSAPGAAERRPTALISASMVST